MAKDLLAQLKDIDIEALARIKRRVWLVGRFNQENRGKPDVFLFTKRQLTKREVDAGYREQFTKILPLKYDAFVTALRPALSEKVVKKGRLQAVQTTIPRDDSDLQKGTLIIDAFNYFFKRAIANSKQPEFTSDGEQSLLREGDSSRGSEILRQIRDNLTRFCEFQPQNHKLLHVAAHLLAAAKGDKGMPSAFYAGHPLPRGFTEVLLDFLYDENTTRGFEEGYLKRIDFRVDPWQELANEDKGKAGRDTFCQIMNALRDHLVYGAANNHMGWELRKEALPELVAEAVAEVEDLQQNFGGQNGARTAYNSLRQIVRSKVLLSMVLEWVLHSLHELAPAKQATLPAKKVAAIEAAVERGTDGLAQPVVRATPEERQKFSDDLGANFATIISAVLAEKEGQHKVPAAFEKLVATLRTDKEMRALLSRVSGSEQGKDVYDGFVDACKTILVDVLCEGLYQKPTIDAQDLRRFFRKETTAVYLTAIFLSDANVEKVLQIAEGNLDAFQKQIKDGKITESDKMQQVLLKQFIEFLADPELGEELEEGLEVLRRVQDLNDVADASLGFGAGRVAVPRTSSRKEGSQDDLLVSTESGRGVATEGLKAGLKKKKKILLKAREAERAAQAAASGTAPGTETAGEAAVGSAATPSESAAPSAPGAAPAGDSPAGTAGAADSSGPENSPEMGNVEAQTSEIDAEIERMLQDDASILKTLTASDDAEDVQAATESPAFAKAVTRLSESVQAYEETLDLIYSRYVDNKKRRLFRNKVERMTLINMMLLWQKDLGLGEVESNLYQMLLDMVQELDPKDPDPMQFLRKHSLTKYFDSASLGKGWVGALMNVLELQAVQSLDAVVSFVSELRGVSHLFRKVEHMGDAEIVVVNADAQEFAGWLQQDNLVAGQGRGRLRAANLITKSEDFGGVWPAMIYMTDIAFGARQGQKQSFLANLKTLPTNTPAHALVLPPICLSTSAQVHGSTEWQVQGTQLAQLADSAPGPVVVVGPSPLLNDEGDSFRTVLPAGYLALARVLGVRDQGLQIKNVATSRVPSRLAVLFDGAESLEKSLDRLVGLMTNRVVERSSNLCFSCDYYLFLVALLAAALRPQGDEAARFCQGFCFERGHEKSLPAEFNKSAALDAAALGGNSWRRFAIAQNFFGTNRPVSSVYQCAEGNIISSNTWNEVTEFTHRYAWFDSAIGALRAIPIDPTEKA